MNGRIPARYGRSLDEGGVMCTLCPRHCRIREGKLGACGVRSCHDGQLMLETYGHAASLSVDPVEKKPLFHFNPGSSVLSLGTNGCNLSCDFCQNWTLSRCREPLQNTRPAAPDDIVRAARRYECRSVALTYNEPVIYLEYAEAIAAACHAAGLPVIAVTAGWVDDPARQDFFGFIDAANVDLKAFTDEFYREHCGADLQTVLDTLKYIAQDTDIWLEVTTLIIEGENDGAADLKDMMSWLAVELGPDVPLHLSAFHPAYKMQQHAATRAEPLLRARDIAIDAGLHHVYLGNVVTSEGSVTRCAQCGHPLIQRRAFQLLFQDLDQQGACPKCGAHLAGRFDAK